VKRIRSPPIANRSEIAIRVMRAASELVIRADCDAAVAKVLICPGDRVEAKDLLVVFE
jgi:pyruvate carboxylase